MRLVDHGARYPESSRVVSSSASPSRALAFAPALLLMDEPLGALDRTLRTDLEDEIRRIHAEVARRSCTSPTIEGGACSVRSVAVIREGKLIQLGSGEELYAQPCNDSSHASR